MGKGNIAAKTLLQMLRIWVEDPGRLPIAMKRTQRGQPDMTEPR